MLKELAPFIAPLIVVALILFRSVRPQRPRRIRPSRLWIGPLYVAAAMSLVLYNGPAPGLRGVLLFAGASVFGVGAGYLRALHQEFSVDATTGAIMSKATPIGTFLFVGLFVARYVIGYIMRGGAVPNMVQPTAGLVLYTDAGLFFALAMVSASAWEVWRRTRPLVGPHMASQSPPT